MRVFFIVSFLLLGCTHQKKKKFFETKIEKGQCLEALNNLPESKRMRFYSRGKQTVGTTASVIIAGIGYSSDVVLYFGPILGIAYLCSMGGSCPAILSGIGAPEDIDEEKRRLKSLQEAATYKKKQEKDNKDSSSKLPSLGRWSYQKTKRWHCPDLDPISKALREVANCYKERGETDKAKDQLLAIYEDKFYAKCLSDIEVENVKQDLLLVDKKAY